MAKRMAKENGRAMRGKSEGSIYQRESDGRWVGSVELFPRPGVTRPRKVVTARTKAELLIKFAAAKKAAELNGSMPTASQTVEKWMAYWLAEIAAKNVRPKTVANYRWAINGHVNPRIGKVRLDKLTPMHILRVDNEVAEALSATTGATVHRAMSSAFSDAVMYGRMASNPASVVSAPLIPAMKLEVLTVAEVAQFVRSNLDNPQLFLWMTFMLTGARRGEILGLTWDRVTDVLDLEWQLQRHPVEIVAPANYEYLRLAGGLYLTIPKSKTGQRIVPLVEPLKGALERWRTLAPTNPHNLVFAMPDGSPIDPDYASKQWPKVLAAAGITKRVRIHDLRHTAVDMMYEAGVHETVIQEIVGHSSRSMTRAYRSRSSRPQLTDAMTKMSALLGLE